MAGLVAAISVVGIEAYKNLPTKGRCVKLDDRREVSVWKYADGANSVEIGHRDYLVDVNGDFVPDLRRQEQTKYLNPVTGYTDIETLDSPLEKGDEEIFNEAITKAGLRK